MVQQIRRQYEAENNRKLQKEKVCTIRLFHKRAMKHYSQANKWFKLMPTSSEFYLICRKKGMERKTSLRLTRKLRLQRYNNAYLFIDKKAVFVSNSTKNKKKLPPYHVPDHFLKKWNQLFLCRPAI